MSKRLSQLNQIEQTNPENYMLLDGENFLESKKVKLKDIDIENFNTTKFYNREQADEKFISKTNVQQIYDPSSEDAASGKAVAAAANGRVPKIADDTLGAPFDNVLMQTNRTSSEGELSDNVYFITGSDTESIDPQPYFIARRDSKGNIQSNTPIKNLDCANKKYVDDGFVKKVKGNGHTYQVYAIGDYDNEYNDTTLDVENNGMFEYVGEYGVIPCRQSNGNLLTNEPVKDLDCANKKYVDDVVSNLSGLKLVVVSTLPNIGDSDTLYFVPSTLTLDQNLYDEYIYTNGAWEKIGSAAVEVDLTNYVKNTDYAAATTAGIIKLSGAYCTAADNGVLRSVVISYEDYLARGNSAFISKGTLENVLAEKIGNIETLLGGI